MVTSLAVDDDVIVSVLLAQQDNDTLVDDFAS